MEIKCEDCGEILNDSNTQVCEKCESRLNKNQRSSIETTALLDRCVNCNGTIVLNREKQQYECSSCQTLFSRNETRGCEIQADKIIPFQVTEEFARIGFYEWFSDGDYLPTDAAKEIAINSCEKLFIPFSLASIQYTSDWSAEIGYKRPANDEEWEEDKDIIVDWSCLNDRITNDVFTFAVVSETSTVMAEKLFKIESFDTLTHMLIPFDSQYLAGTTELKIIPGQVSKARYLYKTVAEDAARRQIDRNIPGDISRNVTLSNLQLSAVSEIVYLPVWQVTYKYKGKNYVVLVSATNEHELDITGDRIGRVLKPKKNNDKRNYYIGMVAFILSLALVYGKPTNIFVSWLTIILFVSGLGSMAFFNIKPIFLGVMEYKRAVNFLEKNEEYQSLIRKYKPI